MDYEGPERRIHRVYVTRNTEYHTRANICVGVRDRCSGEWLERHIALRKPLCGSIKFESGASSPTAGRPSWATLSISTTGSLDVVTSTLESVERPPKSTVEVYAGEVLPGGEGKAAGARVDEAADSDGVGPGIEETRQSGVEARAAVVVAIDLHAALQDVEVAVEIVAYQVDGHGAAVPELERVVDGAARRQGASHGAAQGESRAPARRARRGAPGAALLPPNQ